MRVRNFAGREIQGKSLTVADLSVSLRHSLETMTVSGMPFGDEDYNGDLEENEDMPDFEDDLTDIDTMREYVKGKQGNILKTLHYEQEEKDSSIDGGTNEKEE